MTFTARFSSLVCALAVAIVASPMFAADYAVPDKAKALEAVKAVVSDAAKSGKKVYVWVTLGAYVKAQLAKSDDKVLTVISEGNEFNIKWEKIPQEQLPTIVKNCIQDDHKRHLIGMDFCLATGQLDKAEEFMTLASENSKELGDDLKSRIKALNGLRDAAKAAANPAPAAAVAAAGSKDKDEPQSYKAPDKIAFRPSDFGSLTPTKDVAAAIDNVIEISLAEQGIRPEPLCDDTAFLRRVHLDVTGEIPTPENVLRFYGESGSTKRARVIDELLKTPEYADHWATFWSVLLVGRKTREEPDVKPHFFRSWMRESLARNDGFDKIVNSILTAGGENDKDGPTSYLTFHMNDTLPITVGHVSQTFLGARIACAQCHDHPFDKWTQQDFWGFCAFLANTRSERKELREDPKDPMKITRSWHVLVDTDAKNGGAKYDPPQPELKLPPKVLDGPVFQTSMAAKPSEGKGGKKNKGMAPESPKSDKGMADMAMGDKEMAMGDKKMTDKTAADKSKTVAVTSKDKNAKDKPAEKKMDPKMAAEMSMMMTMDDAAVMNSAAGSAGTAGAAYRKAFAAWITSPKNEKFNQSAVNRIWRNMFGYGLVEPVDDIRPKNPPVYPEVMKILADDFNASGHDLQRLIAVIANTRAYQRSSIGTQQKVDRVKQVRAFARAEVRPMTPEELFMAIIKATGGEEKSRAIGDGIRKRDANSGYGGNMGMGMGGGELGEMTTLMNRFIGTSTAEDRAGKLQFEGTVAQALMMMHSNFMLGYIKQGVKRFKGDMTWLFATTLGRPPTPEEANAFRTMESDPEGMLWVLMNSSEFVTIH
ncbi:MAG: DUF1549 domain-containing protein [Planctomycetota bacterium]